VSRPASPAEEELRRRFDALGPWYTRFTVEGSQYGGDQDYSTDWRAPLFFHWFGRPRTILELGSFEGAHSLMLGDAEHVERLLGLEGRVENVRRAEFVAELLGRGNLSFHQADLESDPLTEHGSFDAVFCAGLLYHLPNPWRLLKAIADVTDRLFLDTHYASSEQDEREGFAGANVGEGGYDDVLSGLSRSSFWLTLPTLIATLNDAGFAIHRLIDDPDWSPEGRRVIIGAFKPPEGAAQIA
jgi:SAM-dependent methyltransferase